MLKARRLLQKHPESFRGTGADVFHIILMEFNRD